MNTPATTTSTLVSSINLQGGKTNRRAIRIHTDISISNFYLPTVCMRQTDPGSCVLLETGPASITPYPYLTGNGTSTPYARYSPLHPYGANGTSPLPWFPVTGIATNRTLPW